MIWILDRCLLFLFIIYFSSSRIVDALLFPQISESRQIQELDGFWNFRSDDSASRNISFENKWYSKPLYQTGPIILMPICSSFNDITTDKNLQKFVGWVWYEKTFYVDSNWKNKRVVLRIESAHYNSIVWINGQLTVTHSGGHLPFEAEVNELVDFDKANRITIAVNNTLTPNTLPTGFISFPKDKSSYPPGYFTQQLGFDFFNYAGIHRKVRIYATPLKYVSDILIKTKEFDDLSAIVEYEVFCKNDPRGPNIDEDCTSEEVQVKIENESGEEVVNGTGCHGNLVVKNPQLWWPYTMSDIGRGYLYTLKVSYGGDIYRQTFGIRTIGVNNQTILINNKSFYCLGVAKHEDSDFRGKGLDLPLIARDFNMMKWLGVNCFRTSHYPYAEEILDFADREGIVVIDECTAVGLKTDENFSEKTLNHHLNVMKELVTRDKNHPSVIMWSLANEPASGNPLADFYFRKVSELTKVLDPTRPVTIALSDELDNDLAAKYLDVLCINRYYAWYQDIGELATIKYKLVPEFNAWHKKYNKPIIITEYGADTVSGLHSIPSVAFTEEYQADFLSEYHISFDEMRKSFLTGEMVWNFADFMTDETVSRVVGNKKGLLSRQRQPKMAAHVIRKRYHSIINNL